jgi:prephenate dehydratase
MSANPRVAFQGEHGAFSEEAALRLLGPNIAVVPRATLHTLFTAVAEDAAELIVVPIENTVAGILHPAHDFLMASGLSVIDDMLLPIRQNVIGLPGASLGRIASAESHPVAVGQCECFFRRHPTIARVTAADTAGSVRAITQAGNPARAAIGSKRAADIFGAQLLLQGIDDVRENYTRFLLLAASAEASRALAILSSTLA